MQAGRHRGPTSLLYNGSSSLGVKRPGRRVYRLPHIALLLSSVSAWNVMGESLPFLKRNGAENMEFYVCVITIVYIIICV